ncbi:type III secretion system regulator LcrR [Aeromonas encheleia]|uniref:LcrR family type III secretion system chaperone n=1 Tax=Aeromonas encheleia TaxID=73010 RepID=UPI0005B205EA|nr:LcrR family type III secretion system chaperone [Aeromonas encheleia]VEG97273.1 type III secretion system regulator LcrR [Aeromonas encheleia]
MTRDPLLPWFEARGIACARHTLCSTPIPLGHVFEHAGLRVAWRVEPSERRIWIVLIERAHARQGLINPFSALYLLAQAGFAVLGGGFHLYGNVSVLNGSTLSGERLARFYRRWAGATEPLPGWFSLDVAEVISLTSMRKQQNNDLS